MASRIGHLALAAMLISLAGCAMCANPFDYHYAAYGSRLPRADMVNGRVGSILDPAGGGVVTTQEIQFGETYDTDAGVEGVYDESSDREGTGTDAEMGEARRSIDGPFSDSPDAFDMSFESVSAAGTDEMDRAFDAIQDELFDTLADLDE
jgi:hypothetical protein